MKQARPPLPWRILSILSVGLVLMATLRPGSLSKEAWIHGCLVCGPYGLADTLRNLLLFLPLGLVLSQSLGSARRAALAVLLLTIGIEFAQLVIPGRDSNPGDVLFNTLGGLGGIAMGRTLLIWFAPHRAAGRVLVGTYVLVVIALTAVAGIGARQMLPEGGVIGQWAPLREPFAPFTGLMHSVEIGERPVPAWSVPNGRDLVREFMDGAPLRLRFTSGDHPRDPQLLLRVVMPGHRELVAVGLHGQGLFLRPRTRFTDFRLFEPGTLIPGVFAGMDIGTSGDVSVFRAQDRYCVRTSQIEEVRCRAALTAGSAWMVVVNTDRWTIGQRVAMIVLVVGVLGFPLGWWGGVGAGFLGVVGIAVGVWGISGVTALGFSPWEVFPLAMGALAGVVGRKGWKKALRFNEAGTDLESANAMSPSETR